MVNEMDNGWDDEEPTKPTRWEPVVARRGRTWTWLAVLALRIAAWALGTKRRDPHVVHAARQADPAESFRGCPTVECPVVGHDTIEEPSPWKVWS